MPGTDASNLAETLVSLARKLLGTPTVGNTLEAMTLGDGNNIDDLVLLKDRGNLHRLLEETMGELNLVGDRATVDLDLHEVGFLLAKTSLPDLGVGENTDNSAVFADTFKFAGDRLSTILSVLLSVPGEGLLLRAVPVFVEATLELVGKMGCPDGRESAEATGGLDITDNANDNQRWCLDDSNGLHNFALVHLWGIVRPRQDRESRHHALDPGRSRSRTTWVMPAL